MVGDHGLVGGDHRLAHGDGLQDEAAGGLQAPQHFHHRLQLIREAAGGRGTARGFSRFRTPILRSWSCLTRGWRPSRFSRIRAIPVPTVPSPRSPTPRLISQLCTCISPSYAAPPLADGSGRLGWSTPLGLSWVVSGSSPWTGLDKALRLCFANGQLSGALHGISNGLRRFY